MPGEGSRVEWVENSTCREAQGRMGVARSRTERKLGKRGLGWHKELQESGAKDNKKSSN